MKTRLFTLAVLVVFAAIAPANAAITGTPIGDPAFPEWVPNSTNALNYAKEVPGREGQLAPFVILDSVGPGSVTLNFNSAAGVSFFEIRLDDVATGTTDHEVVIGDTQHTGGVFLYQNTVDVLRTFNASSTVDVRLALGGERDWDFNWTRFEVGAAVIPEPTTLLIWSVLGVLGMIAYGRRK